MQKGGRGCTLTIIKIILGFFVPDLVYFKMAYEIKCNLLAFLLAYLLQNQTGILYTMDTPFQAITGSYMKVRPKGQEWRESQNLQ